MDTYLSEKTIALLIERSKPSPYSTLGKPISLWMSEKSLKFNGEEINKDLRRRLRILHKKGYMKKEGCIYSISIRGVLKVRKLTSYLSQ